MIYTLWILNVHANTTARFYILTNTRRWQYEYNNPSKSGIRKIRSSSWERFLFQEETERKRVKNNNKQARADSKAILQIPSNVDYKTTVVYSMCLVNANFNKTPNRWIWLIRWGWRGDQLVAKFSSFWRCIHISFD